jgi:hypothetical protein
MARGRERDVNDKKKPILQLRREQSERGLIEYDEMKQLMS